MIVTDLKKSIHSKSKSDVYIDGECVFSLYESDVKKLNLNASYELTEKEYNSIIETVVKKNALNDALRLISRTDYTVKMISEKLASKKYPQSVISYVTDYLCDRRYLDDEAYSERFVKNAFSSRKKGRAYVEMELFKRGINKDLISELIDKYYNGDKIIEIAENKLKSLLKGDNKPDMRILKKLNDYLLRQGFSFDEILSAISELKGRYED